MRGENREAHYQDHNCILFLKMFYILKQKVAATLKHEQFQLNEEDGCNAIAAPFLYSIPITLQLLVLNKEQTTLRNVVKRSWIATQQNQFLWIFCVLIITSAILDKILKLVCGNLQIISPINQNQCMQSCGHSVC